MYLGVPTMSPAAVLTPPSERRFASPKSATFTFPWLVMRRFSGFTSRWTIPCAAAASRP
jgi:hypothetical protein